MWNRPPHTTPTQLTDPHSRTRASLSHSDEQPPKSHLLKGDEICLQCQSAVPTDRFEWNLMKFGRLLASSWLAGWMASKMESQFRHESVKAIDPKEAETDYN